MRYRPRYAPLFALLLAATTATYAQDRSTLTLERIFASAEFFPDRFGPARWLEDGSGYTTLEPSRSEPGGRDIVRYDPASGRREVLVPAVRLVPPGGTGALDIADYTWSPEGDKLLIFTNAERVWRSDTRGDYWVLDLSTWKLSQLGGDAEPSTLMFAKFAPAGDRVAYVRRNNIYVEDLASGATTRLTDDGSDTIVNGTSDWVYEEEFSLRDGFRWSPDGQWIAYWQFDTEGVPEFSLINNTDSLYPKIISFPYPKAGETNSAVRIGVVSASGGTTSWIAVEGDPRNHYIPRMEWAAGSDEVVIQRLNRLQNTNQILLADIGTGESRAILVERDEAWLDVVDDLHWLADGASFTWVSDRDGWQHVYVVSRDGADTRLVTRGEFDVVSVEHVDEDGGWLYYIASPDDPTQRYLFRTRLDGTGESERLSPADRPGWHDYHVSDDAQWAFHTYSRFGIPPVMALIRLPSHAPVRMLVDNAALHARVNALRRAPVEFFRVDNGEGAMLDGWLMRPPDFDSTAQYPLLFYVYGEPASQTVADRWGGHGYLWHLLLAQQGYLVASVDNRGTPPPRGREWRKAVHQKIGIIASHDQAAAARALERRPYVDSTRVGIWGWSGGGSMSLNMIFRYPRLYGTAMAVAPVPDLRYYDTIYQERYMGLPAEVPDAYRRASPITYARQLEGNLLIVHGTGDDNVHYQGTEALINELVAANKQFTMMAYPNRTHGIYEGRGTTLHLYTLLTEYLKENMPPGPR